VTAGGDARSGDALRYLAHAAHLARADDVPELAQQAAERLGAQRGTIYLIDYDQVLLVPFTPGGGEPIAVEGTVAGRAFADVALHQQRRDDLCVAWLPLVDGTDRIGVVELEFKSAEDVADLGDEACLAVASMLAELVVTRSSYGDVVERLRRRTPMTVAAELQWNLLPPLTFVTRRVAVSGIVAPTTTVAGDSFDYAVNGDVAHVAILDAMGHDLEATLISAVAVSTLRNARRAGLGIVETANEINARVAEQFGADRFVTAVIAELDLVSGLWSWVTCGHPPALLVRNGRVVKVLDQGVAPPLGLRFGAPEVQSERLEPGDRVLLYTDGVVEARDADGEFFGTERLVEFVTKEEASGRPAPETLRRLNIGILAHQAGELQDDATTVLVEWLTDEDQRTTP
jgi:hypothetical protein